MENTENIAPAPERKRLTLLLAAPSATKARIPEFKLGKSPALAVFYTDAVDEVELHYEGDPTVGGYFICPGEGCPHCLLKKERTPTYLLPIYAISAGEIQVLRVPVRHAPQALLTRLAPAFEALAVSGAAAQTLVSIARDGMRYEVALHAANPSVDLGGAAIAAFLADDQAGRVDLTSTFPRYTPEELAAVPPIHNELQALGLVVAPAAKPSRRRAAGA